MKPIKTILVLDQYWLLLYQIFFDGKITSPFANDKAFEIMRDGKVSFIETVTVEIEVLEAKNSERLLSELFV